MSKKLKSLKYHSHCCLLRLAQETVVLVLYTCTQTCTCVQHLHRHQPKNHRGHPYITYAERGGVSDFCVRVRMLGRGVFTKCTYANKISNYGVQITYL